MNRIILFSIVIISFFSSAQNQPNKLLDKLITQINKAPITEKYIEKKVGQLTEDDNGRFVLNPVRYPNFGIEFMQPYIGQYNIMIVDATKFENFKNKAIKFDKNFTLFDFITNNNNPNTFEVIKKDENRFTEDRIMLKYDDYEILSVPLTNDQVLTFDINKINPDFLKQLKINYIWFISNENEPKQSILLNNKNTN